jgi:hypothetical protein
LRRPKTSIRNESIINDALQWFIETMEGPDKKPL